MLDSQGREWHVYEREDGSITVYYTRGQEAVHHVVWDSLDRQPTQRAADGGNGETITKNYNRAVREVFRRR